MMICLPPQPQGIPPPNTNTHTAADMAHSTHSTQPALRAAAIPRYPQGRRRQTPADAPTPLKRTAVVTVMGTLRAKLANLRPGAI